MAHMYHAFQALLVGFDKATTGSGRVSIGSWGYHGVARFVGKLRDASFDFNFTRQCDGPQSKWASQRPSSLQHSTSRCRGRANSKNWIPKA